ncbi:MAG: hypothetical protein KKB70_05970 [Proteobacteria bacterium]|nr:hypothetical protein [Pseudomonadota bacterium]MBU1612330.1 hypothetical protein [Pseudomonadota bacterium]
MQPDISALDRFFITYATSRALRLVAWVVAGGMLALSQSWYLLWLLTLPILLDFYGVRRLKQTHSLLIDRLCEIMTETGRTACGLDKEEECYCLEELDGALDRSCLKSLPDTLKLTLVAPLETYTVVSRHIGTIFPPRWLHPLEFHHETLGQTEIYYADVNYVEFTDETLTLHFSNGKTFELAGDGADEALTALRSRLREHKGNGRTALFNHPE